MSRADYISFDGYDAEGNPIFTNHADDEGADSDGDGLHDGFETYVSGTDPAQWDSNGNGFTDGDEWRGFSGVNYASYTLRNNGSTTTLPYYADVDRDGIRNDLDLYPLDAQDGLGDPDGDGLIDMFDSYPDDYWNGNPPSVTWGEFERYINGQATWFGLQSTPASSWTDADGDGIPDDADPYAWDASNNTFWSNAGWWWVDGYFHEFSATGVAASAASDTDGDGLLDVVDPHPNDASNNTFHWNGGTWWINGYEQSLSGNGANAGLWQDGDMDGIHDWFDPYAADGSNNTTWWSASAYVDGTEQFLSGIYASSSLNWSDGDGDGLPDFGDPHPWDASNNTTRWSASTYVDGSAYQVAGAYATNSGSIGTDSDYDGIPDAFDPYPQDSGNNTTWFNTSVHVDGVLQTFGGTYATSSFVWDNRDGDRLPDFLDPYPDDASNHTFWWDGGEWTINGTVQNWAEGYHAGAWDDPDGDGLPSAFDPFPWFSGNDQAAWEAHILTVNPFVSGAPPDVTPALWLGRWFAQAPAVRTGAPFYLQPETSLQMADSDGDGISDVIENFFGLDPNNATDAGGDPFYLGWTNRERYLSGQDLRNPLDPLQQWQGDFIPNVWKVRHGFSLTDPSVAFADPDGDLAINLLEYLKDTDPLMPDIAPEEGASLASYLQDLLAMAGGGAALPDLRLLDTDGDGLTDAEELTLGSAPSNGDSDHDGLSDLLEIRVLHTSPTNPDTDYGGVDDGTEYYQQMTDPLAPWDDHPTSSEGSGGWIAFEDVDWAAPAASIALHEVTGSGDVRLELLAAGQSNGGSVVGTWSISDAATAPPTPAPLGEGDILPTLMQGGQLVATWTPNGEGSPLSATLGYLLPIEVNVNDTADTKDDMVRKEQKIGTTAWRQWIPCTVKIPESGPGKTITSIGVTAESGTMKFSDAQAKPGNSDAGAANVNVTLDAQGQGKFWITGITQSANKGDAKLQIRKNGTTGEVLATQPMTVFWFSGDTRAANDPDSQAATSCNLHQRAGKWTYGLPVGGGIRLKAEAKVEPAGLDPTVAQIADWYWSIVQNASSTRTWHVTRTENTQAKKKTGTVTIPKSLDCANPAGFLFDPGATAVFNASGEAKVDTPDAPYTQAEKADIDDKTNKLDPFGKRYDWSRSTMGDAFTLWGGLVKNDAQSNPKEFVPVFENTWSITADSGQANQKATPSADKGAQPTVVPIVQPPTAISKAQNGNFQWADEP